MNYEIIKQCFFSAAEKITALCIIATLVGVLYFVGMAITDYSSVKNPENNVTTLSYEDFTKILKQTSQRLEDIATRPANSAHQVDPEKIECKPILEDILKMIFNIANKTGQILPRENLTDKIYDRCRASQKYISVKENLTNLLAELNKFNQSLSPNDSLDILDPEYALWTDFLELYFKTLDNRITKHNKNVIEQENINSKLKLDAAAKMLDAKMMFFALCLCIVFFAVICIERNTKAILSLRDTLNQNNVH